MIPRAHRASREPESADARVESTPSAFALAALVALVALAGCSGRVTAQPDPDSGRCGDGVVDPALGEVCDDGVNDALLGGCLPGCRAADRTDELFARPVVEVAIDLADDDWESLRFENKTAHSVFGIEGCRDTPIENPYDYYPAAVTIDGDQLELVGIRKKGHLGSQSTRKPSLKLAFDEFLGDGNYLGAIGLALNNDKSDPSHARTCLAYAVFAAAGLPAPRCTHAHVVVNGQDLGVYTAVEEVKKPFLARRFSDPGGNLYEGTACDFREDFFGGFEQETNRGSDPSRADLQAAFDALQGAADDELEQALSAVFDLDALYRCWAVESLVRHRDGYSGNANNYFLYADPAGDGRFVFLPWGPDSALRPASGGQPESVQASGAIASRLEAHGPTRERFLATIADVLADAWDGDALTAALAAQTALLEPLLRPEDRAPFAAEVATLTGYLTNRRATIEAELAAGPPAWTAGMRTSPCRIPVAPIAATFSTTWDSLGDNVFTAGTGTLTVDLDGAPVVVETMGARAGQLASGANRLQLIARTPGMRQYTITITFPDPRFFEEFLTAGTHPLLNPPVSVSVSEIDISMQPSVVLRRFDVGEGTFTFDAITTEPDAAVSGSFDAMLYLRDL